MIRNVTGAAKAPSTGNLKRITNTRLTRLRPQAKAVANSYWLVSGSRPAPMPRQISAAVCSAKPNSCRPTATLASPSRFTAMNVKYSSIAAK